MKNHNQTINHILLMGIVLALLAGVLVSCQPAEDPDPVPALCQNYEAYKSSATIAIHLATEVYETYADDSLPYDQAAKAALHLKVYAVEKLDCDNFAESTTVVGLFTDLRNAIRLGHRFGPAIARNHINAAYQAIDTLNNNHGWKI